MSDTAKDRFSRLLFYVLVLVTGYLTFQVLSPFLAPLAWAAVFAMMFYRVHLELAARIGPNRAALATTLMAAVLIVAPAVLLVSVLAREVPQVIEYVQQASLSAPYQIERIWEMVRSRVPFSLPDDPTALLREGVQRVLTFLAPAAGAAVADVLATLGSLFVMLFALFFLLRDGHTLGRQIRDLLPLPERERERLMSDTRDLVIASVGAGLLVAAVQGTIAGIAFLAARLRRAGPLGRRHRVLLSRPRRWVGAHLGASRALAAPLGRRHARRDPDDCRSPRRRHGRQRAAPAAPERPDIGERPGRVPGAARRRGGLRVHRARARTDRARDRRQPPRRVHAAGAADPRDGSLAACHGTAVVMIAMLNAEC